MTQFDDLSDDSLMEVLKWLSPEQLFRMIRINQRMKRLATIKLEIKIQAISLWREKSVFSNCSHLGSIRQDQILVLEPIFNSENSSKRTSLFLSILTKCSSVKSIDFRGCDFHCNLLLHVVKRCKELECVKIDKMKTETGAWNQVLKRIGNKIVHFGQDSLFNNSPRPGLLENVAAMCPNIKQMDVSREFFTRDLSTAIKMLPKNCWITFKSSNYVPSNFPGEFPIGPLQVFEDVVDELILATLKWSGLGNRVDRLKSLTFFNVVHLNHGIVFAGLKKLDIFLKRNLEITQELIGCFAASQFPLLEEFRLKVNNLSEADYDAIFRKMPSVKKLTIDWNNPLSPGSSIRLLTKLESIQFYFLRFLQVNAFLQQIEQYVYEIKSLKKLTVDVSYCQNYVVNSVNFIEAEVKRLNIKQNCVEVNFVGRK